MILWEQFLNERKDYQFSSTQINLPKVLSDEIIDWGKKNIKDQDLDEKGRETEIHITVLYGLHDATPFRVKGLIQKEKPFKIELGKISIFESDTKDVLKISVHSPGIHDLHGKIDAKCPNTQNFDYTPHVTIAYMKKGTGKQFAGNNEFVGRTFSADFVFFMPKKGEPTKIMLS